MGIKKYKLVSKISLILRTFMFPNPFVKYIELYTINTQWEGIAKIISFLFNSIIGGCILHVLSYNLVGIIYDYGESPVIGSLLYAGVLLLNSWILIGISNLVGTSNLCWFIILFILALAIEVMILIKLRRLYTI